jgi:hypothetical protein
MSLAFKNFAGYHPDKRGIVAADIISEAQRRGPGSHPGFFLAPRRTDIC